MNSHYPPMLEPATPEYVLAVIQDQYRQLAEYDPDVTLGEVLAFDTTIRDWMMALSDGLSNERELVPWLNEWWGLKLAVAEWQAVLYPTRQRTLRDVCGFLASRVTRPRIRPVYMFGADCQVAGTFLTVRSLLHDAGADVCQMKPSTPLAEYTRRYTQVILHAGARLNPGRLPPMHVQGAVSRRWLLGMLLLGLVSFIGADYGLKNLALACGVMGIVGLVLMSFADACLTPRVVEFGDLQTFRDLAQTLADED